MALKSDYLKSMKELESFKRKREQEDSAPPPSREQSTASSAASAASRSERITPPSEVGSPRVAARPEVAEEVARHHIR